jgi:single-strand DNA-binding protein
MASVNQAILIGNMTRDPQTKDVNGSVLCEFGLATNRKWKGDDGQEREEVCFVDVAAWGKAGEIAQRYGGKGRLVYVQGRLKFDSWEDKAGGGKRSKLSVVAEQIRFLGGNPDAPQQQNYSTPQRDRSNSGPVGNNPAPRTERQSKASEYLSGGKTRQNEQESPEFNPNEDLERRF